MAAPFPNILNAALTRGAGEAETELIRRPIQVSLNILCKDETSNFLGRKSVTGGGAGELGATEHDLYYRPLAKTAFCPGTNH
jgi:hypothetical protein